MYSGFPSVARSCQQACHHENPALRTTSPIERFLEAVPTLNKRSLFGVLKLSVECPTLTRTAAIRVQMAICKFLARMLVNRSDGLSNEGPSAVLKRGYPYHSVHFLWANAPGTFGAKYVLHSSLIARLLQCPLCFASRTNPGQSDWKLH